MLTRIVRHEWRLLGADATLWVVGVAFVAAIGYGVWNGARWVSFQHGAIASASAEEAERYVSLQADVERLNLSGEKVSPFRDPRSPANAGGRMGPRYATLPPGPLASLAIGQSDLLPYYFKVSTDSRETVLGSTEIENPQRLLVGRFDLAFVLIFFYPILILSLGYNMLSSEQEQGTLALTLSQPLALRTLLGGKVALRAAVLLAIVVGCTLAALFIGGVDMAAPDALARLLLWVGAVTVYGAVWFALAMFVASFGQRSAANATLLASAWLVLVVILPSVFNLAATTFFPVPSRMELVQAVRVASDDANAAGSTLLAQYYEDHPELATGDAAQAMTDFNVVRVAVNDEVERRVRPVVDRYEQQIVRQQGLIGALRFISPAVLMQSALYDIAGTGEARHQTFVRQVDGYHTAWRAFFTPLVFQKASFTSYPSTPQFQFIEETVAEVAGRVLISLAGIALPAALVAWLALRRLVRFPVVAS
jgi:ABC-2 type transport system permease protein